MKTHLRAPTCSDCHAYVHNLELTPVTHENTVIQSGERYCFGRKRPYRFKRSDPKRGIPSWCPRRKSPCEARIYDFKSLLNRSLFLDVCCSTGREIGPMAHDYALVKEFRTDLTPLSFWQTVAEGPDTGLLNVPVALHQVVEIDDGIRPACFYKSEKGYQPLIYFNTLIARKNHILEESCVED